MTHRNGDGVAFFREACRRGLEGVIAKRADSRYAHSRSADWLKFKCLAEQEFVIGFGEWTRDGRLRQPRYLGLRQDKPPREVVRERPR